jgi:hypothetical protein
MCIVELARFGDFTVAPKRRVAPSEMGECRGKCISIKYLGYTSLGRHAFLLVTPVPSRQGVFETVRDSVGFHSDTDIEVLVSLNALISIYVKYNSSMT